MPKLGFRCEGDQSLHEQLLEVAEVKKVRKELDENPSRGTRRQLLATSLRLTQSMSPKLHDMLAFCAKKLSLDIPTETYVYNSPQFNAACIKPENGRLLLMFSSAILEKFDEKELMFVMGHELGHHLFAHHDIPIGYLIKGEDRVDARLALQLFSWSRYAEISADRAGALCAEDGDAAARALFKLASGLTSDLIEIRIDEFAAQADEMAMDKDPGKDESNADDWFMTHPFTPLRVKALNRFFQSDLVKQGGTSREQLEVECHELMQLMAPTYLEEDSQTAEMMRRVLFAAGCALMKVSGTINDREIAAFNCLFGEATFGDHLNIDKLEERLDIRIEDANAVVPLARRIHVIRDLCLIARADGRVTKKERDFVHQIGRKLELSPTIIEHSFDRDVELD
jgi:hypothetical protein